MSGATSAASMGAMSIGMQAGGVLTSAMGSHSGASSQKSALKGQARLADINARIAELGAHSALEQGKQQVAQVTHRAGQLKGSQRATMAANGIDLGAGNAAEVQASTDMMKEIDSNTVRHNALRNAWGHRTQSMNYTNEANMARANASGISPGGSAFSSLLGGATQVASSWYGMNQGGMFDTQHASIDALAASKGFW